MRESFGVSYEVALSAWWISPQRDQVFYTCLLEPVEYRADLLTVGTNTG